MQPTTLYRHVITIDAKFRLEHDVFQHLFRPTEKGIRFKCFDFSGGIASKKFEYWDVLPILNKPSLSTSSLWEFGFEYWSDSPEKKISDSLKIEIKKIFMGRIEYLENKIISQHKSLAILENSEIWQKNRQTK